MFQDRDVLFRFVSVVTMSIVLTLAIMLEPSFHRVVMIGLLVIYNCFAFLNLILDGSSASSSSAPKPRKIPNPNPSQNPNLNPNNNNNHNK